MKVLLQAYKKRRQSARMQSLKEQQASLRAVSRSTKFVTPAQKNQFRKTQTPKTKTDARIAFDAFMRKDGFALAGIFGILGVGAYIIVFQSDQFVLRNITVNDTQFIPKQEVIDKTNALLQDSFLGIPKNRYWTISESSVTRQLKSGFANNFAAEDIQVTKKYPNTLQVQITERVPSVIWATRDAGGVDHYYTIDHKGVVTAETTNKNEVDTKLPQIFDKNRAQLGIGWQIIHPDYLSDLMAVKDLLVENGWNVESFVFPVMTCKEQEYVAQQIFADAITDSTTDAFKEKKRVIQEQFKKGELDIEESLAALEEVKKEEQETKAPVATNTAVPQKLEWATVDKVVACDFVQVASDLHVLIQKDGKGVIEVKFDTMRDMEQQVEQLRIVTQQGKVQSGTTKTVDVRIADRVYIK